MTAADFYHYRPLPVAGDPDPGHPWLDMARELEREGASFLRLTVVDDANPSHSHPAGCYAEGWKEKPVEQPPFDFPLDKIV